MLTKKQRDLLIMIHERLAKGEVAPSFDEMREGLGLKSKSGIHRLIGALEERGFLERLPNKARALHIRKLPDGYEPAVTDTTEAAHNLRAHGANVTSLSPTPRAANENDAAAIDIPLFGKIAAGTPIEAIAHEGNSVTMPADMVGRGDYYALTIDGDSMIEAGINDGDTVLIQRTDTAHDGDIVVALVDDQEATLKEIRRRGGHVDLVPKNRTHEIRTYEANRVRVQGKLAGLCRTYH
jgi:repressor LexA